MKRLLYIDLFCGAGGTSTGVSKAMIEGERCAEVIACINHDANAIASHAANHPEALHFTEDIRTFDLSPLIKHLQVCKAKNPEALTVLWASLECTNFSKAKGGRPRDADSRTLAEHLFRYIEAIDPEYIQIENVAEFMSWGEVDENGRPVSKDRGRSYVRWVNKVKRYGYKFDHRILNAADFGAYTSRKRFFGIFAKKSLPIAFPIQTHSRKGEVSLFGSMPKWRPVKEVLDFEDEGKSIFGREKPLSENTLERIYVGLIKYVAGSKEAFMLRQNGKRLGMPCNANTTQGCIAPAKVAFLSKQFSGSPQDKNISIDQPAGTITTVDHHAFVTVHYGNGYNHSCDAPAATLTTKDHLALVQIKFLDMQYGNGTSASIETAAGTITTNPKHHLVMVKQISPEFEAANNDAPAVQIFDNDSPMTVKIKEFMLLYNIIDITMRMLKIPELKLIMGFPEDYILIGTQADQKKFIGNAVECNMAAALCTATAQAVKACTLPQAPFV